MVQQLIELAPGVLALAVPDAGLVREHPDASAAVSRGAAPGAGLEHEYPDAGHPHLAQTAAWHRSRA